MSGHVRVDGDGEAEIVVFAVEVVEVVAPEVFDRFRVNPALRVGGFFDEHLFLVTYALASSSILSSLSVEEGSGKKRGRGGEGRRLDWWGGMGKIGGGPLAVGRRDTNSRGSRRARLEALSRAVSSTLLLFCCSRFWSICRRCGASRGCSRGGRRSGLVIHHS